MSRFDYVKYDETSTAIQGAYKKAFMDLDVMVTALPDGRAKSLVLTKLEEAYMWVGKAVRDAQVARGNNTLQEERTNG